MLKIKSVIAVNNLPVRRNRTLLPGLAKLYPGEAIGIYAETKKGDHIFDISFDISDGMPGDEKTGNYSLSGKLNGSTDNLFLSSTYVFSTPGEITFSVSLQKSPRGFLLLEEVITWELIVAGTTAGVDIATTRLQLCFLPKIPLEAEKGIPVELVEFTSQALSHTSEYKSLIEEESISRIGYTDPINEVAMLTNWVFSRPQKPVYDTYQGSAHFTSFPTRSFNNITLNYTHILSSMLLTLFAKRTCLMTTG